MNDKQFSQLVHESLRVLNVKDVSITKDFEVDRYVCRVVFLVDAEDEIGAFSALHTVVAGVTEHLMRKYSKRNKT